MAQTVLKISDEVGRMPTLLDGAHVVQFSDSKGASQIKVTVSERGAKYAVPTKDGDKVLDKPAFQQLLRDSIEKDGMTITLDPDPVAPVAPVASVVEEAKTPWALIIGAAVVGYLLGRK